MNAEIGGLARTILRAAHMIFAAAFLCSGALSPAGAQLPTAEQIEQLRRAQQSSRNPGTELDRSRADAVPREEQIFATPEELELRRLRSRQQLDELQPVSLIERSYRIRTGDRNLRQFGYDLFRGGADTAGPLTGAVGRDYILGVGDEVVVTFTGATNDSQTARVARDGRIFVSPLPPVQAAGRSLGAVQSELAAQTRANLLGTDVYVSVGGVRSATIYVGGEVERPGQYQVTSFADVVSVLSRAGGVRKTGSLRYVRITGRRGTRTVDLYGLLGIGSPAGLGVQDGDRVVVPVVGDTVAITGNVSRPAIYELRGDARLEDILSYAGGAVPPRGYRSSISRINVDGSESFLSDVALDTAIRPGDAIFIVSGSAGGVGNDVALDGFVANPGVRALATAPTVKDLIGDVQNLRPGTYLPMAVLERRSAANGMRRLEAVDLYEAITGITPVELLPNDRLYVFSNTDIEFINAAAVREILLGIAPDEPEAEPQCTALLRLRQIVSNTQSARFDGVLRNVLVEREDGAARVVRAGDALASGLTVAEPNVPQLPQTTPQVDRPPDEDDALGFDDLTCRPIFEANPDLLPYLLEQSVSVGGAVRRPGGYPVARMEDAATLIAAADGILSSVGEATIDVRRGASAERFAYDSGMQSNLQNLLFRPGDDLRITANTNFGESGAVLLSGEVRSPGLYSIRPGERLSQVIARAGGYTETAYPYGAVFTRQSVREAERRALIRASSEIRSEILTAAARGDVDPEGVEAVNAIIGSVAEGDVPGRLVVETDLNVLSLRPDLDPLLESGDQLFVPNTPVSVYVFGNVLNPGALQFSAGRRVSDYVEAAGGVTQHTDEGRIYVVYPNGTAQPAKRSFWRSSAVTVPPGTTIYVPRDLTPIGLDIAQAIASIVGSVAQTIATTIIIADRNN